MQTNYKVLRIITSKTPTFTSEDDLIYNWFPDSITEGVFTITEEEIGNQIAALEDIKKSFKLSEVEQKAEKILHKMKKQCTDGVVTYMSC